MIGQTTLVSSEEFPAIPRYSCTNKTTSVVYTRFECSFYEGIKYRLIEVLKSYGLEDDSPYEYSYNLANHVSFKTTLETSVYISYLALKPEVFNIKPIFALFETHRLIRSSLVTWPSVFTLVLSVKELWRNCFKMKLNHYKFLKNMKSEVLDYDDQFSQYALKPATVGAPNRFEYTLSVHSF